MKKLLFITGPTGSGKTDLSLHIAQHHPIEIVNADVGQFYVPLTIGTAKPDWQHTTVPHHLFDIIDEPRDFDICSYRLLLQKAAKEIWSRGNLPVVVGGSLFYIKSILFPPCNAQTTNGIDKPSNADEDTEILWKRLQTIDPVRAAAINPQDTYRIRRALLLYEQTGQLPSTLQPIFEPFCNVDILFLDIDRAVLYDNINKRTEEMLSEGWIQEIERLFGTTWITFLKTKKLIGYPEIIAWIEAGKNEQEKDELIQTIKQKTRQYAKRQLTFWKKFRTLIESFSGHNLYICRTQTIRNSKDFTYDFSLSKRN